jgi:hypothetical protein
VSFYTPEFTHEAMTRFRQLDLVVQEAALDVIEQMLTTATPPGVARRLPQPVIEMHDVVVTVAGRKHYIFVQAHVVAEGQKLRVVSIAAITR